MAEAPRVGRQREDRMQVAVVVSQHGGPEVLQLQQHPIPATPDDGVLIEQHCAGVNYIDTCVAACD